MRDIKFRAWDKKKNDWFDDEEFLYIGLNGNIIFDWNGEIMDDYTDRIILMQYTGMKDVKGVEIYEGDIIREDIEKGEPPIIVSVVWKNGAFYGKERKHEPEYIIQDFLNGEVIGNIYETPELLEE